MPALKNVSDEVKKTPEAVSPDQSGTVQETPSKKPTPPPTPAPKKTCTPAGQRKYLLPVFVGVGLLIITLVAMVLWFFTDRSTDVSDQTGTEAELQEDEDATEDAEDELEEEESAPLTDEADDLPEGDEGDDEPVAAVDQDRVLYIKEGNIWVVNNDGTGKTQITIDGDDDLVRYRAIAWKEAGVISYSKCAGSCKIYTRDLATDVETEVLEGIPLTQSFDAIEWSHDGDTVGYIFTKGDYSKEASLWTGGLTVILESYAPSPGRGGHYDDGMYLEFSPDDSKVLVLNTIIDTAHNKPVMLFETDGTMVVELADVTFPSFDGNDAFYYKSATGDLARWNEITATSSTVTTFPTGSVHNLHTSPDGYFVLFWSDVGGVDLTQAYYDTGGSSSSIATDYVEGKWLDDGSVYVVAIEASTLGEMGLYLSGGISKLKRTDGTATVLDTGAVSGFEVE